MTDITKPGDPADKAADGAFGGVTSHRAGYGDKLARVEDWVRRWPSATLSSGEGAVLLEEIDRLRAELAVAHAAIDRVAALCDKPHQFVIAWEVLRALDGEAA
jgi:hypothetical protein